MASVSSTRPSWAPASQRNRARWSSSSPARRKPGRGSQPVFDAIGQRTIRAGHAGAGTRLKVVTNSWVLAVVEAGAETIALAEGLGVDPGLFFKALDGGMLDLPYLRTKGAAIAARDFSPSFRLKLAAKDASLVGESALQHGLDRPVFATIAERLSEGRWITATRTSARRS